MKKLFALILTACVALVAFSAPASAESLDSPQSCSVTTAPGTLSFARPYHYNYVVDVEWWLQVSSGPGCSPKVRVAGNIFFTSDGNTPINGGISADLPRSEPRLFESGYLITDNPDIYFGSSGTDGVYTFYSGWIARDCGKLYKGGIYISEVAALGFGYEAVHGSYTSAASYAAPAC